MKKLSIVTPLYNTKNEYLNQLIECLVPYGDYIELILVNDSPSNFPLNRTLANLNYTFIKIVRNITNLGIFQAYCNGFLAATGEYICIVDHDDVFSPQNVLSVINNNYDLIYTDEYKFSKIDKGIPQKLDVFKKPDFDMLSSTQYFYTHHVTVIKTEIIQRVLKDESIVYPYHSIFDLWMFSEYLKAFSGRKINVFHINSPDYGWRMHENSTALKLDQKISGYYERLENANKFFEFYGEIAITTLNKKTNYLVECCFPSNLRFNQIIDNDSFLLAKPICIDNLKFKLSDNCFDKADVAYFKNLIAHIPLEFLRKHDLFPVIIPSKEEMANIDQANYDKHPAGIFFLSTKISKRGLLINQNNVDNLDVGTCCYSVIMKE